jgi:hypothetical protein
MKFKTPWDSGEESEAPAKGYQNSVLYSMHSHDISFYRPDTLFSELECTDYETDPLDEDVFMNSIKDTAQDDDKASDEEIAEEVVYSSKFEEWRALFIKRTDFLWRDPVTLEFAWRRVLQSLLFFFLLVLSLNALCVTTAFWKAGSMSPKHVGFEAIRLVDLDQDHAYLSISGQLQDTFLMNHIQFRLTKPLVTELHIEPVDGTFSEDASSPLLTFTIPQGELVDPKTRKFSVTNVEIVFNNRFPIENFADLLTSENLLDAKFTEILGKLPKFTLKMDYGISTRSFWIPLWFTSIQKLTIDLAKEAKSFALPAQKPLILPSLFKTEFVQTENSFEMSAKLSIPSEIFPSFLYIEVPSFIWEFRQKTLNQPLPEDGQETGDSSSSESGKAPLAKYSASHRICSIKSSKQILDGASNSTTFSIGLHFDEHDRRGVADLIGAFRDVHLDDLVVSVAYNSKAAVPCKGLCKFLSSFELNIPTGPIAKSLFAALAENSDSVATAVQLPTHSPIVNLSLEGLKKGTHSTKAAFTFTASVDLSFLPFAEHLNLHEMFISPLPPMKTLVMFDSGTTANPECLVSCSIVHRLPKSSDERNIISFALETELNDLSSLTRVGMLFGTMSNTKQKLFVAGSSETFLSALFIDPLAIEVAASMQAKPRFRHGKRLLLESVLSELVGPDLLSSRAKTGTAVFKDPVYHKCTLSTGSTDHQISVNGHFNFADSASSVEAPFVNISWSEIAFTLFPGLSAVELLTFKLRKGKCNLYLLPEKNPILLIHDGFVDFAVNLHTKESSKHQKLDSFLMNWKSFVRSLVNPTASKFVPVSIHGQSGVDSFKIDTSVPTRTALLPFLHAFILKSTNSIHELPKNWENWFKSLAETTVKVSGLRGLTTQLLLEMPQMEIFSNPHEPDSFGLDVRVEMTSIDLNICRRNRDSGIISYSLWFCFSHPVLF